MSEINLTIDRIIILNCDAALDPSRLQALAQAQLQRALELQDFTDGRLTGATTPRVTAPPLLPGEAGGEHQLARGITRSVVNALAAHKVS